MITTWWWWGGFGFGVWRSVYPGGPIWSFAFGPVTLLVGAVQNLGDLREHFNVHFPEIRRLKKQIDQGE